jgi:hypothetical protein
MVVFLGPCSYTFQDLGSCSVSLRLQEVSLGCRVRRRGDCLHLFDEKSVTGSHMKTAF